MKLQKLAWYAKVWTLVAGGHFIDAEFEKWTSGPVNYQVYMKYQEYGAAPIRRQAYDAVVVDDDARDILCFIVDNYVDIPALSLSAMIHCEDPWICANDNELIKNDDIIAYYSQQSFAKNFLQDHDGDNKSFYVIRSNAWHAFTMDMDKQESDTFATYASPEEFREYREKAGRDFSAFLNEVKKTITLDDAL
ncbi:MAG TPA: DUF4065 domain-containing protein [Desulfobulbaceae bacterium]|nr:DUF4065 domain-containing protein [Desulfobulbaceae bacterium]